MPVLQLGNDDLKVDIAAPQDWTFVAGDAVIGTVVRRSPIVTPEATLNVELKGELKVNVATAQVNKLQYSHSIQGHSCTIDKQLWTSKPQELVHGPLHIADASDPQAQSWPFELQLPLSFETPSWYRPTRSRGSTLPNYQDIIRGPLPGSFSCFGDASTCWIEYYLKAELQYSYGGKQKICTSTYPVILRPLTGRVFEGFGSHQTDLHKTLHSHHLLPEKQSTNSSRSLKQVTRELIGSSKVPQFAYKLEVVLPTTIQLSNPEYIPLKFRLFKLPKTSDSIKDNPPKIWLTSAKLSLTSQTYVYDELYCYQVESAREPRCCTSFSDDLGLEKSFGTSMEMPLEDNSELDIGNQLQLVLHSNGLKAGTKHLKMLAKTRPISPNFYAHYIRHCNKLNMEFTTTVAGHTERMACGTAITILPE